MRRRRFLQSASVTTVGMIALAGCGAPGQGAEDTPTGEDGGTPGDETTPTETMGGTPTESPTDTGTPTSTTTSGGQAGGQNSIAMVTDGTEYYFDPVGLFLEPGETVTWTNQAGSHSSTAYAEGTGGAEETRIPEGAEAWDSGILTDQDATFEATFEVTGTYDYFCTPHKQLGMVGRLVVGEPGGPADGSQPPDGDVPESAAIVEQGSISWEEFTG